MSRHADRTSCRRCGQWLVGRAGAKFCPRCGFPMPDGPWPAQSTPVTPDDAARAPARPRAAKRSANRAPMREMLAGEPASAQPRPMTLNYAPGMLAVLAREDLRAWPRTGRNLLGFAWLGLILALLCTSRYLHAQESVGGWGVPGWRAGGFGLLGVTLLLTGWSWRYHAAGSLARAMVHFIVTLSLLALACLTFSDPLY